MGDGYLNQPMGMDALIAKIADLQEQINALRSMTSPAPSGITAGGVQAISIPGTYTDTLSSNFTDTGWIPAGDSLTFHTYSGKFLLINIASQVLVSSFGASGDLNTGIFYLGYTASGATVRAAANGRASFAGATGGDISNGLATSLIYTEMVEGAPGEVTVRQSYKVYNDEGSTQGVADNRALIVFPF